MLRVLNNPILMIECQIRLSLSFLAQNLIATRKNFNVCFCFFRADSNEDGRITREEVQEVTNDNCFCLHLTYTTKKPKCIETFT